MGRVLLVVGTAIAAVVGVSTAGFSQAVGAHITGCGFDATGAYANVRVDNVLGVFPHKQEVWVDFSVDGRQYTYRGGDVPVPALGHGKIALHAPFPNAGHHVSGRTVYTTVSFHGPTQFVTKRYAEAHQGKTWKEVVPDASHTLSCRFDHTDPD